MPDNMELGARVSDGWHEIRTVLDSFFIIVARWGPQLVGYLVTASRRRVAHVPVIAAMMRACPGTPGSYVYGPICVAATERGHGLAGAMFAAPRAAARPGGHPVHPPRQCRVTTPMRGWACARSLRSNMPM
jgi:hypothetical protein